MKETRTYTHESSFLNHLINQISPFYGILVSSSAEMTDTRLSNKLNCKPEPLRFHRQPPDRSEGPDFHSGVGCGCWLWLLVWLFVDSRQKFNKNKDLLAVEMCPGGFFRRPRDFVEESAGALPNSVGSNGSKSADAVDLSKNDDVVDLGSKAAHAPRLLGSTF